VRRAVGAEPLPSGAVRQWRERLIHRTEHRLRFLKSFAPKGADTLSLAEPWTTSVQGPQAASQLLLESANPETGSERHLKTPGAEDRSQRHLDVEPIQHSPVKSTRTIPAAVETMGPNPLVVEPTPERAANPAASELAHQHQAAQEIPLIDEPFFRGHEGLWTPEGQRSPHSSPLARNGSNGLMSLESHVGEDPDTGADLSVLSAKMKRILDEEARRHGIDV
jgi:hypothetical protein